MNVRSIAARVVYDVVVKGCSLAQVLPTALKNFKDVRDQALLQALCYGVCRWYYRLDAIAQTLLERPMKERDLDIYILLLVGLYQLMDMRIPAYAAVTETVNAVRDFKKMWAKGLLNGILRQYQREANTFNQSKSHIVFFSHPRWIIERIQKAYPEHWEAILSANNEHPPFSLRVNQQHLSRKTYLEKLTAAGMAAEAIEQTPAGIVCEKAWDVDQLPGFAQGDVSVQDGAAQLAAQLLCLEPKQAVLDACAAPGGKTAHMLEVQPDIYCTAVDNDAERLAAVTENLQRLQLNATCLLADAANVEGEFDRILLDAPCSASGVIRRHPDIKLLRRESDIKQLAEVQTKLLNAVWNRLKPGGILVYATCSIFPEENTHVVQAFLQAHTDAREEKIEEEWGIDCEVGKQILPGMYRMDGFYFARLRKQIS